LAVIVDNSFF